MPFIIETRPHIAVACDPEDLGHGMSTSRRAVATIEEARLEVTKAALRPALLADNYEEIRLQFDALHEQGGTIGPLPDGTVIEVRRVTPLKLASQAGMTGEQVMTCKGKYGGAWDFASIIDAYNAQQ